MRENIIYLAIVSAVKAGAEILKIYNAPDADFGVEMKADNSPLTIADKISHQTIVENLQQFNIPILSEEGTHLSYAERSSWRELWVVDPLDGTKEFIKRNGEFTVNIALVEKGAPVLGVIYVPVKKDLYFAERTIGAFKMTNVDENNIPTDMSAVIEKSVMLPMASRREKSVVVASRSHLSPETQLFIEEYAKRHPNLEMQSAGSSLKICMVAEGAADVYPRFAPTMEWDTAAGHAIAHVAGCRMYNPETGQELIYNKEDLHNSWFIVDRI